MSCKFQFFISKIVLAWNLSKLWHFYDSVCAFSYTCSFCIVDIKIKMLCEAFKRLPTSSWKSTNFGQFNPGVWVNVSPFMIYLKTLLILSTLFLENWCWDFHVKFKCEIMYHVHCTYKVPSQKRQSSIPSSDSD